MSLVVMNCTTGGLSTYGLDWIDVAAHNDTLYGVTETAVEMLSDAGTGAVSSQIKTGDIDFGTVQEKSIPRAYLTLRAADDVTLTTDSLSHGVRTETDYTLAARALTEDALRIVPLARGLRGQFWSFAISGADVLSGAAVLPTSLSRRGA